jgi:hypothetical protein
MHRSLFVSAPTPEQAATKEDGSGNYTINRSMKYMGSRGSTSASIALGVKNENDKTFNILHNKEINTG